MRTLNERLKNTFYVLQTLLRTSYCTFIFQSYFNLIIHGIPTIFKLEKSEKVSKTVIILIVNQISYHLLADD
ncbi:hypothetical protein BACEGG_01246 [Bacteroides eggerthii DSM 20697]|nr:hypothetical protein BACEGG_01246 [Bacteroides eggerthii DSM 20697]